MALTKLNFSGQPTISHVNMPAGSILQKQLFTLAPLTSHISTTSTTSAQASNVQISITPKKANSKILIEVGTGMTNLNSSGLVWELYEDSTALITESGNYASPYRYGWIYGVSSGSFYGSLTAKHTVDAGSTNLRTYKLYHKLTTGGSGTGYTAHEGNYISMYATEIAQ